MSHTDLLSPEISLIIPAHNEEQRLAATLALYGHVFQEQFGPAFELLVVANGCTDQTAQVAADAAATLPQIRVIDIPDPIGKGGAVVAGFRQARGARVLFADADAATTPASLLDLLAQLEHADIAIGSRRLSESVILQRQPLPRRIFGHLFAGTVRTLFGMPYRDTQCGAKALRRAAAQRLATVVTERRWAFDVELLLWARACNFSVIEHPVTWTDGAGSKLRITKTITEVVHSLWRLQRQQAQLTPVSLRSTLHEVPA